MMRNITVLFFILLSFQILFSYEKEYREINKNYILELNLVPADTIRVEDGIKTEHAIWACNDPLGKYEDTSTTRDFWLLCMRFRETKEKYSVFLTEILDGKKIIMSSNEIIYEKMKINYFFITFLILTLLSYFFLPWMHKKNTQISCAFNVLAWGFGVGIIIGAVLAYEPLNIPEDSLKFMVVVYTGGVILSALAGIIGYNLMVAKDSDGLWGYFSLIIYLIILLTYCGYGMTWSKAIPLSIQIFVAHFGLYGISWLVITPLKVEPALKKKE